MVGFLRKVKLMVNLNSTASFLKSQMVQRGPCASSPPNPRT